MTTIISSPTVVLSSLYGTLDDMKASLDLLAKVSLSAYTGPHGMPLALSECGATLGNRETCGRHRASRESERCSQWTEGGDRHRPQGGCSIRSLKSSYDSRGTWEYTLLLEMIRVDTLYTVDSHWKVEQCVCTQLYPVSLRVSGYKYSA